MVITCRQLELNWLMLLLLLLLLWPRCGVKIDAKPRSLRGSSLLKLCDVRDIGIADLCAQFGTLVRIGALEFGEGEVADSRRDR